jgi:4-alpha-glucanotransferase
VTSTPAPPPQPSTDPWGIDAVWLDDSDEEHTVSPETVQQLREVIGHPPVDLLDTAPIVARPGDVLEIHGGEVACEDGSTRAVDGHLPEDFPLGYHRVRTPDGRDRRLIVSPGRCWLPEGWRGWGWAVQLYGVRSEGSWGIGDLADLRALREMAAAQGAGFLLVNPLHAVAPTAVQEASPYLPATRRFRNPLYLRVAEVPGADAVELDTAAGRELNDGELVDRDAIWALKRRALQQVFDAAGFEERPFRDWWWHQGQPLQDWATWCALADEHGPDWQSWPEELRDPRGDGARAFAAEHEPQVAFHAWLQWAVDLQLRSATEGMTVIQDLPIGVAGGGADAWAWQDVLAQGVSVGAPPDAFNGLGQDWGSPPLVPWRLQRAEYEPFIQSIRATMAGAGGLRVDHVMGLFRLWWVPVEGGPKQGAYVRYPYEDMLDIVALESHRAQAIVVGEDLGVVEDGVREAMAEHGILSYKVLYFEDDEPAEWPATAMAAVTTHDLPTIAGLWTGADLAEQREHELGSDADLQRGRTSLLEHLGDVPEGSEPAQVVEQAYRRLAGAPCTLLSATLEDALGVERRPNMPGTTDRPNWSLPLSVRVEDLPGHAGVQAVAGVLAAGLSAEPPKAAGKGSKSGKGGAEKPAGKKATGKKAASPKAASPKAASSKAAGKKSGGKNA